MNSLILAASVLLFLLLGYHLYGRLIDRKVVNPDPTAKTPASAQYDGVDFSPARKAMLFGHHFSSIAGAGPIVGPVIAVFHFGWLAALGWIALGSVFIGGVHDYLTLMVSVRHRGASIADIARDTMGQRAKAIFSAFLWLALVLVITVFAVFGAETMVEKPEIALPVIAVTLIAILVGWLVYRKGLSTLAGTVIGLVLLFFCIYLGSKLPISIPPGLRVELPRLGLSWTLALDPLMSWVTILIIYALIASVLPVWLLLQPRDYISSYILFIGLGLGFIGLIFSRPVISAPLVTSPMTAQGPIWPMLFVVVACGAISGFHSLVSSGTTSKQLANEVQGRLIGYGGMLTEGALALLALLAVGAGLRWSEFSSIMGPGGGGNLIAFGSGYGNIVKAIPGISLAFGILFAILMVNTFILTTLDTATRLARFIVAESAGARWGWLRNRWLATVVTILPALYLSYTGQWKAIWPVFGAANQLIAALALVVITTYLVGVRKPTRFTLIPAIFMLLTTISALAWQAYRFFSAEEPKLLLGFIASVLIILALFVTYEAKRSLTQVLKER